MAVNKLIDLFGSLQSEEEKQDFLQSQFNVITNLSKEVEQLKAEKKHLETLLKASTPNIIPSKDENSSPDEELIAREQLRYFKSISEDRELTLEETRKVEIYSKILLQNKEKKQKEKSPIDSMTTGQLLELVQNEDIN